MAKLPWSRRGRIHRASESFGQVRRVSSRVWVSWGYLPASSPARTNGRAGRLWLGSIYESPSTPRAAPRDVAVLAIVLLAAIGLFLSGAFARMRRARAAVHRAL